MKKTVLITGASSGIGKATALFFANKGWNVIATMRSPEKETELVSSDHLLLTRLDVQQSETATTAIAEGIARFGGIDLLVNNAGYGLFGLFESFSPEEIQTQFDINVFGVMHVTRAILPHFQERKGGAIINISSGAGRFTLPMISLYCASKFALEGFSEALSFELDALNIRVKIVEPGGTATNFNHVAGQSAGKSMDIHGYEKFVAATTKMFDGLRNMRLAESSAVAGVIYEAATDGTNTLRYVVGNEDFKRRVANRLTMPDQVYVESVKNGYLHFME